VNVGPNSLLDLSAAFTTETLGGVFFDHYDDGGYKFAGVLADTSEAVIGHVGKTGDIVYDAVGAISFDTGSAYDMRVALKGTTVSVGLMGSDGQLHEVVGHVFNAVTVDGDFGLLSMGGQTAFDSFAMSTDDPALAQPLMAAAAGDSAAAGLAADQVMPLVDAAIRRLAGSLDLSAEQKAALAALNISVTDLPGLMLARTQDGSVEFDIDAAGNGWFVDSTPGEDSEFRRRTGDGSAATPASAAYGQADLLTALVHEFGHAAGLTHASDLPFMAESLSTGQRLLAPAYHEQPGRSHGSRSDVWVFNEARGALLDVDESAMLRILSILDHDSVLEDDFIVATHAGDDDENADATWQPAASKVPANEADASEDADADKMAEAAATPADSGEDNEADGDRHGSLIDWNARSGMVSRLTSLLD
jgi:hypothetical protein